jgi:hypothetical protein
MIAKLSYHEAPESEFEAGESVAIESLLRLLGPFFSRP